jgi:hypothetical protein
MQVPFFGGCACGAIRYRCSEAPVAMVKCHCRDCQRASGGPYAPTAIVRAAAFEIVAGSPQEYLTTAESGAVARRAFCGTCGAPLFASSSARPEMLGIRAGSLDDPGAFAPAAEVWVASAPPWDRPDPALPHFARSRSHAR